MREILFRGKRIDNGEWAEGYYFIFKDKTYITNIEQTFMGAYYNEESVVDFNMRAYEIDPETLCQYTGLKDKNSTRIWENDYISCKQYVGGNQIDYHVEFGYVEMKYGAFGLHRKQGYYRPFKDWLEDYEYEVQGNIFDNPELLKED